MWILADSTSPCILEFTVHNDKNAIKGSNLALWDNQMDSCETKLICWDTGMNSSSPGQNDRHFAIFKRILLNEKFKFFYKNSIGVCSLGFNWLDNGLAPTRWQAIIWTNADPIYRHKYAALEEDELITRFLI